MFDSLADKIREDEHKEVSRAERIIKYVVTVVLSLALIGGLYYVVQHLE